MTDAELIALAKQEGRKAPIAKRTKRAPLLAIINELPADWPLTSKVDWLITHNRITQGERQAVYSSLFRLLKRRKSDTIPHPAPL
jgi:hypothetical protein